MRMLHPSRTRFVDTGRTHAARHLAVLLLFGLLFAAGLPVATLAQSAPVQRTDPADPIAAYVTEASQRFGIPAAWIRAVMRVESAGDVRAISRAGAMGLMQIMPDTWAALRRRLSLGNDPYDPRDNILAGAAYLREMHDRYGAPGFLAAYNAGSRSLRRIACGRPCVTGGNAGLCRGPRTSCRRRRDRRKHHCCGRRSAGVDARAAVHRARRRHYLC